MNAKEFFVAVAEARAAYLSYHNSPSREKWLLAERKWQAVDKEIARVKSIMERNNESKIQVD
jgi:hypothetical protein